MRSKLDLFHDPAPARSSGASSTTVGSRATEDFLISAEFAFQRSNSNYLSFWRCIEPRKRPSVTVSSDVVTLTDHRIAERLLYFPGGTRSEVGFPTDGH